MDPMPVGIQYFSEYKRVKYRKLLLNIIVYLSVLSRTIENEIKDLNIRMNKYNCDVDINYLCEKF